MCWVAMECFWNDGSETQYYVVILDRLQGCSGGLEQVLELCVRDPLTDSLYLRNLMLAHQSCLLRYMLF